MLALSQIQERHHGGLLVLLGVSLEDLGHEDLVFLVELEWEFGVVVCSVSMLEKRQEYMLVAFPVLLIVLRANVRQVVMNEDGRSVGGQLVGYARQVALLGLLSLGITQAQLTAPV